MTKQYAFEGQFETVMQMQQRIESHSKVSRATLSYGQTLLSDKQGIKQPLTYANAVLFVTDPDITNEDLARTLSTVVLRSDAQASERDMLRMALKYGYDLGIWAQWSEEVYTYQPNATEPQR